MATARRGKAAAERPLLLDELAMMDDVAASESVPADVASTLETSRLYIAGAGKAGVQARQTKAAGSSDCWEFELPTGAFVGQPGLTGDRLDIKAHRSARTVHTAPMRPPWASQAHQPRPGAPTSSSERVVSAQPDETDRGRAG